MSEPAYFSRYDNLHMSRDEAGVLLLRMHSGGGPIVWDGKTHRDFVDAFYDIGRDRRNRAVILTGTGDEWMLRIDQDGLKEMGQPWVYNRVALDGRKLLENLLDIEVPMVAAINGPARLHSELALLCDAVLCSEDAVFQDRHLEWGLVPGDGVHIVWPAVLGPGRGRYFLMTGQQLDAQQALQLGVANEVLPKAQLMPRALELATRFARLPTLAARYSRLLFARRYKQLLHEDLGYGLALEGLSAAGLNDQQVP
ncbi:MAG: enoyl-CoA hydratase/isomerase family protein [Nevskia sp.]|nr:enoyl-CoA hydratase/isomerase family protein [Nevskia sp.]